MARAQGAVALGPVKNPGDLEPVLRDAVAKTRSGAVVVVEALVVAEYRRDDRADDGAGIAVTESSEDR